MLVKFGSFSEVEVKIKKTFELPPPSFSTNLENPTRVKQYVNQPHTTWWSAYIVLMSSCFRERHVIYLKKPLAHMIHVWYIITISIFGWCLWYNVNLSTVNIPNGMDPMDSSNDYRPKKSDTKEPQPGRISGGLNWDPWGLGGLRIRRVKDDLLGELVHWN